ncbi:MAG: methyltransferase domain-containing protein [Myxococcota bacterium]
MSDLSAQRRAFAERLGTEAGVESPRVRAAFATVPREAFLSRGPWLVLPDDKGYRSTPNADPAHLYQDVAVAIDATRMLNNGAPGFLARLFDALALREGERVAHIGCAVGYYSAILAEIVGPRGRVFAIELDPELCERARRNLDRWRQVEVRHADGREQPQEPVDVVFVHGGVTHAQARWLEAVGVGGRLAMPVTAIRPTSRIRRVIRDHAGRILRLERRPEGFAATVGEICGMQALLGGRDAAFQETLRRAYQGGDFEAVRSLRTDAHPAEASCWAHRDGACLSRRAPGEAA